MRGLGSACWVNLIFRPGPRFCTLEKISFPSFEGHQDLQLRVMNKNDIGKFHKTLSTATILGVSYFI